MSQRSKKAKRLFLRGNALQAAGRSLKNNRKPDDRPGAMDFVYNELANHEEHVSVGFL
jgi:hypothetical protein